MNKKGIVISPPFSPTYTGGVRCGGDIDSVVLRKYLMYWDEIDYPSNSFINISSPDIEYLETTESLKRTHVNFQGTVHSGRGEFFIAAQEAAFSKNEQKEPGCWDLAQLSEVPFYTNRYHGTAIDFELYGMLPIPSTDTPLNDILEFKEKQRDELLAFRVYLDEIYQQIISSADIPRAKNTELAKLEIAVKDLDKLLKENLIKRTVGNIRNTINIDFSGIVGAGLGGAGVSSIIGMSPLIAGMAGAGLVIGFKSMVMPNKQTCSAQFNYIKSVRKNFKC